VLVIIFSLLSLMAGQARRPRAPVRALAKLLAAEDLDDREGDALISLLFFAGACLQALACWNAEFSVEQGEGERRRQPAALPPLPCPCVRAT